MSKYVVEAPHTAAECLATMDEVLVKSPRLLDEFHWGCMGGVHDGWAVLEAESESAARNLLPGSMRNRWPVTEVTRITPELIEAYKAAHREE